MTHSRPASADRPARELFDEMARWPIFDPHTHIDPHRPAARHFDEILGYHYYTELAHSAGMPAEAVSAELDPDTRAANLVEYLDRIDSTVQYSWLLEIARTFHRFPHDRITPENLGELLERADHRRDGAGVGPRGLEGEPAGSRVPDQRVRRPAGGLGHGGVRPVPADRRPGPEAARADARPPGCERRSDMDVSDFASLRQAIGRLFERFVAQGARACAVSLPPDFAPRRASHRRASTPIRKAIHGMDLRPDEHEEVRCSVFWMLAEFCAEFRLPFDLMIGPIRNVYPAGVAGGRDLFDRRVSLYDYRELVQSFRGCHLSGLDALARRGGRAGGLFLDLSQRAADGPLVVFQRAGVHRRTTCARGSRPCPRPSCWDIIQMRTSSSSSRPNSTCTGGSWRMFSRKRRSAAAAGRSNGPCTSPNSS